MRTLTKKEFDKFKHDDIDFESLEVGDELFFSDTDMNGLFIVTGLHPNFAEFEEVDIDDELEE